MRFKTYSWLDIHSMLQGIFESVCETPNILPLWWIRATNFWEPGNYAIMTMSLTRN